MINLINGVESGVIDVSDRGLAYGDGVFRTLILRAGKAVFWRRQYGKLAADCRALAIDCPPLTLLEADLSAIAARLPDCVVKIIVTRGCGRRGYAVVGCPSPQRIVSATLLPQYPAHYYTTGVRIRWCRIRLALQPVLAGIKHLNRLENVLARAEWTDSDIAEGLMLDMDDNVTCGTMSNLFLVRQGELLTPDLSRSGVAGVTRQVVLESMHRLGTAAKVTTITAADVFAADEVFLVNSVIGLWQVAELENKRWAPGPLAGQVRNWLADVQRD